MIELFNRTFAGKYIYIDQAYLNLFFMIYSEI